jgi:hypothetical protein
LIRNVFEEPFSFQLSGVANVDKKQHLVNFHNAYLELNPDNAPKKPPKNWFEAFHRLSLALAQQKAEKKIIFLDELPWLDTPQSKFIAALDYFWNSWASARTDILLIVCSSAAAWIINICEMKFSTQVFSIGKPYAEYLKNKLDVFENETKTKKTLFLTMITTFGLVENEYTLRLVKDSLEMKVLFEG